MGNAYLGPASYVTGDFKKVVGDQIYAGSTLVATI